MGKANHNEQSQLPITLFCLFLILPSLIVHLIKIEKSKNDPIIIFIIAENTFGIIWLIILLLLIAFKVQVIQKHAHLFLYFGVSRVFSLPLIETDPCGMQAYCLGALSIGFILRIEHLCTSFYQKLVAVFDFLLHLGFLLIIKHKKLF